MNAEAWAAVLELRKVVQEAEEIGMFALSRGLDAFLHLCVFVDAMPDLIEAERAQADRDAAAAEVDTAIELYALEGALSGTTARASLERLAERLTKDDVEVIALRWTARIATVARGDQAVQIAESVALLRAAVPLH